MPPIRGCIQAAMVLMDSSFASMSFERWKAGVNPKVEGSWNLHLSLPKGMDFLILLSSACGIFGNSGQSNYVAGNVYQDALARYRVSICGEKATALDLGPLLCEGYLAENDSIRERFMRKTFLMTTTQDELLALLDFYCSPDLPPSTPLTCQTITGLELPSHLQARGLEIPSLMHQPLFRTFFQIDKFTDTALFGSSAHGIDGALTDFRSVFAAANSLPEAAAAVSDALKKKLSHIIGTPEGDMQPHKRMESYGVDSLVAVELRNWFAKEMAADIAVFVKGGILLY
ncbi:hypothetical protein MMC14_008548 [Varicellaria rhodocarpa]|nr:hypothetical protein [Varicellaria rhodocarpa]